MRRLTSRLPSSPTRGEGGLAGTLETRGITLGEDKKPPYDHFEPDVCTKTSGSKRSLRPFFPC